MSSHSRSASDESNATSMSYILEHVLQYPGRYEIPLRTMYTLNCIPRSPPLPKGLTRAQSPNARQMAWTGAETAAMSFTSQLMTHLTSLPTQPSSLPPTFIVNFVNRCFHAELQVVDFPQALTALDYLRDLETRRRKEMMAAFERVHLRTDSYDSDMATMAEKFPGIALWVKNVEGKNKKAESYYAQLWLGLRRWIMVNELSMQPFNKLNCMGMLNTLLPPMQNGAKPPSSHLDVQTLRDEREAFFDYIRSVQKNGPDVLRPILEMNKGPDEETGWPSVQRVVDKYTRVAKQMIDDCLATTGPESFERFSTDPSAKKTDSGVSFGSQRRPSVGSTLHEKHLPEPMPTFTPSVKGLSKLERITREFRRMRVKPRHDVEEMVQIKQRSAADYVPQPGDNMGKKSLKKARSLASLKFGNGSSLSLASRKGSDAMPSFDPATMKKHRALYEASVVRASNRHA
ncbi:hypothetical protein BDU57DRAFT_217674 [Ampelomyces quisqualis]|uniref:Uncharacterized protein n=1 Tax=Ampelomyces quisqualis TaxID=50730 RepID=A0A6A5QL29_AMPQU|nr:hypothetical protein BDU57DRAFT_217674 [Ampelomyces quisqualis]